MVMDKLKMTTVKSKWETSIKEIFPSFKVDAENENVIKLILLYIARDERFETAVKDKNYSLHKGICLHGNYGTGKTKIMHLVQRTLYYLQSEIHFKRFNMRELCQQYQTEGASALSPDNKNWFVDEFGLIERENANSFGNKLVVGDELIGVRYDRFQSGYITHLTTNLTYQQMNDFYNPRTISRLHEMCNFIPLDGTDRRLTAKPGPPVKHEYEKAIDKRQVKIDWWNMIIREHAAYKAGGHLLIVGAFGQFKSFEDAALILMNKAEKEGWIEKAKQVIAAKKIEDTELKASNKKEYNRI